MAIRSACIFVFFEIHLSFVCYALWPFVLLNRFATPKFRSNSIEFTIFAWKILLDTNYECWLSFPMPKRNIHRKKHYQIILKWHKILVNEINHIHDLANFFAKSLFGGRFFGFGKWFHLATSNLLFLLVQLLLGHNEWTDKISVEKFMNTTSSLYHLFGTVFDLFFKQHRFLWKQWRLQADRAKEKLRIFWEQQIFGKLIWKYIQLIHQNIVYQIQQSSDWM